MSAHFIGTWQRVVTTSHFGTFALGPDLRSFVVVEPSDGSSLAWRFGSTLEALRVGYTTQPAPGAPPHGASGFTPLSVAFGAGAGHGELRADGLVCTLTLMMGGNLATLVYRVIDADTLAVSMAEVPCDSGRAEDADRTKLSQGFLFRVLDAAKPSASSASPGRG